MVGRHRYRYSGPVTSFGRVIAENWTGETIAPTKKKARSNLIFCCKREMNLIGSARLEFPGTIERVMVCKDND